MITALLVAAALGAPPTLREYLVDSGHSIVEFSIGFAFTRIKGRFPDAKGTILYDEARPVNSSVTMVIETKTLDTGWPHRDEHLRTSDFFDVEKFPTIEFYTERLVPNGDGFIAYGPLTMHGVTKVVALPFHLQQAPTRDPQSRWLMLNVAGSMRLARADFGITGGSTYNSWFNKARAATVADSVEISYEVEGYSVDAASNHVPQLGEVMQRINTSGIQAQIDRFTEIRKTRPANQMAGLISGFDIVSRALIEEHRVKDALALARAGTEQFPADAQLAALYALTLSIAGDKDGATREYARMKQIYKPPVVDPNEKFPQVDNTWWYLDQLARNALEWGLNAQALTMARIVAELYPNMARAHTTLGTILAINGDAKGAAAEYAKALTVDPRETRALEWRRRLL